MENPIFNYQLVYKVHNTTIPSVTRTEVVYGETPNTDVQDVLNGLIDDAYSFIQNTVSIKVVAFHYELKNSDHVTQEKS